MSNSRSPRGLMSLSRRDMDDVYGSLRDQASWLQARKGVSPTANLVDRGRTGVGVLAGSMAVGYVSGRLGTGNIPGTRIPAGLVAGAAIQLAAAFLPLGRFGEDLSNVGWGAMAGWGAMWTAGLGQNARANALAEQNAAPEQQRVAGVHRYARSPSVMGVGAPSMHVPPASARAQEIPRVARHLTEADLAMIGQPPLQRVG